MDFINHSQVNLMLRSSPEPQVRSMASDASVVGALVSLFAATLQLAPAIGNRADLATAGANKALAVSRLAEVSSGSDGLKRANFVGKQVLTTVGLTALSNASPARAGAVLTFTVAEKIVSAVGFADQKKISQCELAVASLAATAGLGAVGCAGTVGLGCAVGAIVVANEAFATYFACRAPAAR